ncbi:hypothetical protein MNB_SUP05-5-920 [hydrothermal vent metagenome]|uniref:Uncharacterized protein n=1 Tax=hydrothermal vent metagenome TaxID=652676 RepID=A0A1W1C620_9ZZZZ
MCSHTSLCIDILLHPLFLLSCFASVLYQYPFVVFEYFFPLKYIIFSLLGFLLRTTHLLLRIYGLALLLLFYHSLV